MQKKAKGGGGEVGQRAEGGEKRCSSAFSSAFVFKREPHARFTRITFFLSQQFEGARIAAEDLSFHKAYSFHVSRALHVTYARRVQVLCKPQAVCPKRALRNER